MAFLLLALLGCVSSLRMHDKPSGALTDSTMSPVRKVVTLIEEMKEQCEKDATADTTAYDKYACWCETNKKEKSAAIEAATQEIARLTNFLEQAAAKEGELKSEISGLADDIASDQDALATATAIRAKEHEAFAASEADMKESIGLLAEAEAELAKVQLVQAPHQAKKALASLMQVRDVLSHSPKYHDVMQKDLFDVLDSLQDMTQKHTTGAFLGESTKQGLLPWEKTEEQIGKEANPNDEVGMAAGAKSYNSRSGSILGILSEMKSEFVRDLSAAQKQELNSLVEFQNLRAAKTAEIAAAMKQKKQKEAALADLLNKAANAREDKAALEKANAADQEFLVELEKSCTTEDEEYHKRAEVRTEEIRALGEALVILTSDDSRDLFGKTISFIQVGASADTVSAARLAAQNAAKDKVLHRLAKVASRQGSWMLASLAVRVRLDAFEKVKEIMDKMLVELQDQQKEEYAKWERCKKDIDETEDSIKVGEQTKKDLDAKHTMLSNSIDQLHSDIDKLKAEIADMEVSLKAAGEDRHGENMAFQTSVSDQRAAIQILNKALARLKQFYATKGALVQEEPIPGRASSPAPPKPKDYEKSGGSGGVVQLIMKIISEAEVAEKEMEMAEQKAQEDYASVVRDMSASIEADRAAITEKSEQLAKADSEKAETEEAQGANQDELDTLGNLLKAHHLDCDYLLKYFNVRQTARQEEMDAITDAKAILSGADFGK